MITFTRPMLALTLTLLPVAPALAGSTTLTATVAGPVADADGDGFGDNHAALPGFTPVLAGAAVHSDGLAGGDGVVRVHIEWNLDGLGAASVHAATVTLFATRGSIDSAATSFFIGDAEQDGLLTDADFEAPATLLPGVSMPVTDHPDFTFEITGPLNEALAAGRQWFSLQARIDEDAFATSTRGLQIRTSATTNPVALHPLLTITLTPPDCPGDATGDNLVNFDDLNLLLEFWNQPVTPGEDGDVDDTGFVDFTDLNLLLDNWNHAC